MFNIRFWRVLRLWTTVCCLGSTTRPKQRESVSLRAHPSKEGMKKGPQGRDPCIPVPWSQYREAPHAGTLWSRMTRKTALQKASPHPHLKYTHRVTFLLSLVWVGFQLWVLKGSASCCSLESSTFCSPTGR